MGGILIRFLESKLKYDFCIKSHNFLIEKVDISDFSVVTIIIVHKHQLTYVVGND